MNKTDVAAEYPHGQDRFSELLENRLALACRIAGSGDSACTEAALEHFAAGGSRVRARICFDAGTRLGLTDDEALLAATVCELLHNASLIQDDLLDRTAIRRGKPSVWARYGDTVAVCTGDLLLSAAYDVLADLSSTAALADALRLVHRRTGEVIAGQAAEFQRRDDRDDTIRGYERQARGKSASLLSLSLELPLLLSGDAEHLATAYACACHFAVAYQIADDLADCEQDAQEGSPNLLLLLRGDGLTLQQARQQAIERAAARLACAEEQACLLPRRCAATLLYEAKRLRERIACQPALRLAHAGD